MNPEENFCPQHGPYNAALGSCPYCNKSNAQNQNAFRPLDDDMLDTEYPGAGGERGGGSDDGETVMPVGRGKRLLDDDVTQPPDRFRRGGRGPLDEGEEDGTKLYQPPESKGMLGWLVVKSSPSPHYKRGKFVPIKSGQIWGGYRGRADVKIDDEYVSELHARIVLKNDEFVINDVSSSNGTFVNDEQIEGPRVLHQDDEIKMGNTVFVLKILK